MRFCDRVLLCEVAQSINWLDAIVTKFECFRERAVLMEDNILGKDWGVLPGVRHACFLHFLEDDSPSVAVDAMGLKGSEDGICRLFALTNGCVGLPFVVNICSLLKCDRRRAGRPDFCPCSGIKQ